MVGADVPFQQMTPHQSLGTHVKSGQTWANPVHTLPMPSVRGLGRTTAGLWVGVGVPGAMLLPVRPSISN